MYFKFLQTSEWSDFVRRVCKGVGLLTMVHLTIKPVALSKRPKNHAAFHSLLLESVSLELISTVYK
jgi:hypothetical protein